ncbi:MAG: FAD-dependent monooxygenase [Sphingobacteriales bacterium]|nr:MAG: FAD-dependent monooxygenase [Sphingobacteriales bacterium]
MARSVTILGAGLVGSLLAIILRKKGYDVTIYERRPDMRVSTIAAGRSINLAMSTRGWHALELAGLKEEMEELAIPMTGRYLHQADGSAAFQPYGKNNEAIYSVSRGELNKKLMTVAEKQGAKIHFDHRCTNVDVTDNTLHFTLAHGTETTVKADLLFGADGAFSALRKSYSQMDRVNAAHNYLAHGYKELSIPPDANGKQQMEQHALHIWPRKNFMMIALPNTDGTFTCTLFLPFDGSPSFEKLKTDDEILAFFKEQFPDAVPMMPTLLEDFKNNPTSSLITTHIAPWHYQDKSALIGDAAHAIVPFYGQGMNAGFEDCSVMAALMDEHGSDWDTILNTFDKKRKPNGDAVAQLALLNFVEMRDKVADPAFLERKKIEKELGKQYPEQFTSIYEMVTFSHTPYSTTMSCIAAQDELLAKIMQHGDFFDNISKSDFNDKLTDWVNDYHNTVQKFDFNK